MYKTNYSVTIKSISAPEDPLELTGDAAQAAIAQMTSHRDVDVVYEKGGHRSGRIIPYHDIDSAIIEETRTESEYTDDNAKNCVIPGSGETGDFTITNNKGVDTTETLFASAALNGTYGDVTFDSSEPSHLEGIESVAENVSITSDNTLTIAGVPVGTKIYRWASNRVELLGTVPGSYVLQR